MTFAPRVRLPDILWGCLIVLQAHQADPEARRAVRIVGTKYCTQTRLESAEPTVAVPRRGEKKAQWHPES